MAFLIPIWPIFKEKTRTQTGWFSQKYQFFLYQIKLSKGGRREHFRVGTFVTEMLCRKKNSPIREIKSHTYFLRENRQNVQLFFSYICNTLSSYRRREKNTEISEKKTSEILSFCVFFNNFLKAVIFFPILLLYSS